MRYIKTYENQRLEYIKNEQIDKLSVLRFIGKIQNIFKKDYNIEIKFEEEEAPNDNINAYSLSYGGSIIIKIFLAKRDIAINYNHQKQDKDKNINLYFSYNSLSRDFNNFSKHFFKHQFNMNNVYFTAESLNEISDKIENEYELFIDAKKYNL